MSLKKIDISKSISSKAQVPVNTSSKILDSFISIIKTKSVADTVKIPSFGTFQYKVTPQRVGRNPKTKEIYAITERVKLKFEVSNKIKNYIN